MTSDPKELNRRVAFALGWEYLQIDLDKHSSTNPYWVWRWKDPSGGLYSALPKWSTDLNCTRELEQAYMLDSIEVYRYTYMLMTQCWPEVAEPSDFLAGKQGQIPMLYRLLRATACQRVQAWLAVKEEE